MSRSSPNRPPLVELRRFWRPPPPLSVSEWAERHAVLTAEVSAEPGRWHAYPYQVAILDAFSTPEVETVVVMKSARVGWTRMLGHVIGYHIAHDPCSILFVQPAIEDAKGESKEAIQPMLEETPALRGLVAEAKSRSGENTIQRKFYPGGILHIIGANSPRGFRRITVRVVLFDEVDAYPPTAGVEGDQIKLGMKRAETFANRKIGIGSTPTIKGLSRVESWFERSSRGYFLLPCPHCGAWHVRLFLPSDPPPVVRGRELPAAHLEWRDDDPTTATWVCRSCGAAIEQRHNSDMLAAGRWYGDHWEWTLETGFRFVDGFGGIIGFHVWTAYALHPGAMPQAMVREYLDARGDDDRLVVFYNTVLGRTFEVSGETVEPHVLLARRERYEAEVPDGVLLLTAGVDVQGDRLEVEVVGWGEGEESWSIDYVVLPGDPTGEELWDELDELLTASWEHESGATMKVALAGVDAGYLSSHVYEYVRRARAPVVALKGMAGQGRPLVVPASRRARLARRRPDRHGRIRPEIVGVDEAKLVLYRRLAGVTRPGPGYCHFPEERDEAWFRQLTAEKLIIRRRAGREVMEWRKVHERNEALDCRIYALAALRLLSPDWQRLMEELRLQNEKPVRGSNRPKRFASRFAPFASDEWLRDFR